MKGRLWVIFVISMLIIVTILANATIAKKHNKINIKSNMGQLYLLEKNPETWEIVDHGAWGKMKRSLSGSEFEFSFNGHGLEPETWYCLIYYPDPWPGEDLYILGEAMADDDGNVKISGLENTGDMPSELDENWPDGAKIWLVLSDDVDGRMQSMVGWNPSEYLFEYDLIKFDDIDNNR